MTVVVPFDNSDLSRRALTRAEDVSKPLEDIVAVTVIPNGNRKYARERGWLAADDEFDPETIVSRLSQFVSEICAAASFEYIVVDRYAKPGQIASKLRAYARECDARLVVIGSDNAGRLVSTISSVGCTVATDLAYEVLIVRHPPDTVSV